MKSLIKKWTKHFVKILVFVQFQCINLLTLLNLKCIRGHKRVSETLNVES